MLRKKLVLSVACVLISTFFYTQTTSAATHIIKNTEDIEDVAKLYKLTVATLMKLNDLENVADATVGFELKLPADAKIIKAEEPKKQEVKKQEPKKVVAKTDPLANFQVVKTLTVQASAFTASCNGCSGKTASGINLKKNPDIKLIAVDPKIIPLGTKVWVEGYGIAIAGDTGGSIKGHKIDIFVKTKQIAYNWGRKKVQIKILK